MASPAEKAPGPDDFNGAFFRACWSIFKSDVMAVFHHFFRLAGGWDFGALNTAMLALVPKKDGATCMEDFFTDQPSSLCRQTNHQDILHQTGGRHRHHHLIDADGVPQIEVHPR